VNLRQEYNDKHWITYVFKKSGTDKLEFLASPVFKKLNAKTMTGIYKATVMDNGASYLVPSISHAEFDKLVSRVFTPVLTFRKM
jgi:hypothetical protein